MASDIGAKIGLEGEAEFKRALKDINNEAKELSSQLSAVKKGFDNSTTAEEKFNSQADILQKKMENAQKKVELLSQKLQGQKSDLENAKTAVQEATEKYGENSKEVADAQAKYNKLSDEVSRTQQELNKATGEVNGASSELKNLKDAADKASDEQDDLGDEVKDTGEEMNQAKEKTNIFAETLKSQLTAQAIINGIKAIGDAVREIADAVQEAFTSTVNWADELDELSTQTGISSTELQKLQYMSGLVDTDVSTVTGSLKKLTKSMDSASEGTGASYEAFQKLGVSVKDANGELKSSYDVFYEVIDALGEIQNPTERDAQAMTIFGKSAQELNPMIEKGSTVLKEFGQEAEDSGYVLSDQALEGLTDVADAFDRVKNVGDSAIRNAFAPLAPTIATAINSAIPSMQLFAQNVGKMFSGDMTAGDFTTFLMTKIQELVTWISENLPTIMAVGTQIITAILTGISEGDIVGQAITIVTTLIDSISQNLPQLMETGMMAIMSMIEGLTSPDSIGSLVQSGINLILSLTRGLIQAIPQIIQAIPTIVQNLVVAFTENLPMIIVAGMEITMALIEGLITSIPDLIAMLPEIGYRIIEAFGKVDWASVGTNIVNGILGGLSSMWNTLVNKAKEMASKVLSTVKGALGIHSPSRVFRDQVGKMIPAGLESGIDRAMPSAIADMESQMDNLVIGASASLNGINAVSPVGNSVSNNYGGFVINVNAAEGQSANDIAEAVMYRIQNAVNRREAVFA